MYSRVEGGVSAPRDWKATPPSVNPFALMKFPLAAIQFEL